MLARLDAQGRSPKSILTLVWDHTANYALEIWQASPAMQKHYIVWILTHRINLIGLTAKV